jgi:replicative DNA helicase
MNGIESLRVPPHSIEAEQSVLGSVMLTPAALEHASEIVSEEDFYQRGHRLIWRAITELDARGQPFDAVTMMEHLTAAKVLDDVGGMGYVIGLANETPSAVRVRHYARIVRSKAQLRAIIDEATNAAAQAFAPDASPALLDEVIQRLMRLQRHDEAAEFTIKQAEAAAFDDAHAAYERGGAISGISTGFVDIDEQIGGWSDGDFNIIGARPGMGKTSLMLCCTLTAAELGKSAGVISAEMSAPQLGARMLAISGRVNARGFRTGKFHDEEWGRIVTATGRDASLPIRILDRSRPSIDEVRRVATRWKKQHGLQILFVDYLQRITAKGDKRNERIGEVAVGLKTLARDLKIPVVCLAQVGRDVEKRANKVPVMADLSDSGEIEKEADQVAFLYRGSYYDPNVANPSDAELHIDKNRHGPCGKVDLTWIAQSMRYVNHDPHSSHSYANAA